MRLAFRLCHAPRLQFSKDHTRAPTLHMDIEVQARAFPSNDLQFVQTSIADSCACALQAYSRETLRESALLNVIEEVAAECEAEVIWLAPYSPDFSPIELMWSKIKARMRAAKARTREELERALVAALELVTNSDCRGWFRYCGYQVARNRN